MTNTLMMLGALMLFMIAPTLSCGSGSDDGTGTGGMPGAGGGAMQEGGASGSGGESGADCLAPGTLIVSNSGATAYVIDRVENPDLTLCRGATYSFDITAPGHPFYVKTVRGAGTGDAYDGGVTGNGTSVGTLTFAVPADAPDTLYYDCSIHAAMSGVIHVVE
jgi:hypothetical protein